MRGWTFHPAFRGVWRGSGSSGLSRFFGLSGFFGFAQQEKQDKPNKLENLAALSSAASSPTPLLGQRAHLRSFLPGKSHPRLPRSIGNLVEWPLTFFEVTHGQVDDRVSYLPERTRA